MYADQTPEGKLDVVRAIRGHDGLRNVVMVGDGINDAPALALADVGIAMAGKGATISSETADVVIMVDDASRIVLSLQIGRCSLHIARESVVLGLGLSAGAMLVAVFGLFPPVWAGAVPGGRRRDGHSQRAPRAPRLTPAATRGRPYRNQRPPDAMAPVRGDDRPDSIGRRRHEGEGR